MDRSDTNFALRSAQRISAVRRVDRDSTPPHPDGKSSGGRNAHPETPATPPEIPQDIVEVSPVSAPATTEIRPQPAQPPIYLPETERLLDIQV